MLNSHNLNIHSLINILHFKQNDNDLKYTFRMEMVMMMEANRGSQLRRFLIEGIVTKAISTMTLG